MKRGISDNSVDYSTSLAESIVHLARLALAGNAHDVTVFVARLARKIRERYPEAADELRALGQQSPVRRTPLREVSLSTIPVDVESRLQLARLEFPVRLPAEPIWSSQIQQRLKQVLDERKKHERELQRRALTPTRSMLFTGPPGVGKSLAARWLASGLELPLVRLDLSAVMSSFLGRTGNNLRNVFDYARSIECVLLLDEFDAIAKRRDDIVEVGELKRLVTVLLQEIEEWSGPTLLIAATNHPHLLDPAVWRRFDAIVDFPMPSNEETAKAIELFLGPEEAKGQWKALLALSLKGLPFSEIEREVHRLRREATVLNEAIENRIEYSLRNRMDSLSRTDRRNMAILLVRAGYSQRTVHAMTKVSRDTMRRYLADPEGPRGSDL